MSKMHKIGHSSENFNWIISRSHDLLNGNSEAFRSFFADVLGVPVRKIIAFRQVINSDIEDIREDNYNDVAPKKLEVFVKLSHGESVMVEFDGTFEELLALTKNKVI